MGSGSRPSHPSSRHPLVSCSICSSMSQASTTLESGALLSGPRGLRHGSPGKRLGSGMGGLERQQLGQVGQVTGRQHLQAAVRVPNFVDNVAVLTYLKYQHSPPTNREASLTAGAGGPIGAWQVPSLSPGPTQRQVPGSMLEGMGCVFYSGG